MKIILTAIALLISTTITVAQEPTPPASNPMLEEQKQIICSYWVKNAMYGVTQNLRGASKETKFITLEMVVEMIEHELGADALYLLDENYTPVERQWLISSTMFGYDWMQKWLLVNAMLSQLTGEEPPVLDPRFVAKRLEWLCHNNPEFYEPLIEHTNNLPKEESTS